MGKIESVIRIPTSIEGNFFKFWLQFLKPFHNLTEREIQVAAELLKQRYELSKVVKDTNLLDKILMSDEVKRKIKENCNISQQYFQIIIGKLRKVGIIVDNKLNPKFIPDINNESSFQLLLYFDLTQ